MKAYVIEKALLQQNMQLIRQAAGDTIVWAVLKGNGYGLGVTQMAQLLLESGVDHFAVTQVREAVQLREAGLDNVQILMLRQTEEPAEINALMDLRVIMTVGSLDAAVVINGIAAERAATARVHLKVDTGMGRYGFMPEEVEKLLKVYDYQEHIQVCGIYTHFSCAFCNDKVTKKQYETFMQTVDEIRQAGYKPGMVHCCNSAAFLKYPEMHADAVRIGSAFLGRLSFPDKLGLKKIGHAEATVEELRWLKAGATVGYGAGWKAKRPTQIAVLGIGWYHGFSNERGRDLFRFRDCLREIRHNLKWMLKGRRLHVTVNGETCRVLGHVGMVNTIVDVTDIECAIGDRVVLQVNPLQVKGMKILYR